MCICVNCAWVDRCKTYHSVEEQHGASHIAAHPDFQGIDPKIHIILSEQTNGNTEIEWDVRSCGSFSEDQGKWLRLQPGKELPS